MSLDHMSIPIGGPALEDNVLWMPMIMALWWLLMILIIKLLEVLT